MAQSITEARNAIREIDRAIDANRAELLSRCTRKPKHWLTWGHAWARNPDLAEREHALFRQRAEAALIRDRIEARAAIAKAAAETRRRLSRKPSKCASCGSYIYA